MELYQIALYLKAFERLRPSSGPKTRRGGGGGPAYDPAVDIPDRLIGLQRAADAERPQAVGA
ncbi:MULTISPECIES: hypothetical protein [unclassified Streptomyces]|uniref:hypothetical protein n=1 Tax=unclassified Streptomyces TaxID=2593676 RepID=UPI00168BF812|nr:MULTISPECIES: hypothetical protein [unclassified Streptomyces]MBD3003094.1 hypothetical protein [Streptomyces sp. 5-10]